MKIKMAGVVRESIVDGPGLRFVVFTQGCPHHCEGCHNPDTHDPEGGYWSDTDRIVAEVQKSPIVKGVTLSGGDPFAQPEPVADLAEKLHALGYDIIAYTGFTMEMLLKSSDPNVRRILNCCSRIVDGRFVLAQRSLELKFRGSRNQRVIDVPKTLAAGEVVTTEF